MNKSNGIVIYNVQEPFESMISSLNTLFNLNLTEDTACLENNVLVAQVSSASQAERTVKEINEGYYEYNAITLNDFEAIKKQEIEFQSLKPINPINQTRSLINEMDLFFLKIGNNLILYENDMAGKIKEIKRVPCRKYFISPFSNYLALLTDKLTIIYGSTFEIYYEIFDPEIQRVSFSDDERFVFIHNQEFSMIYDLSSMSCITETELTDFVYNAKEKYFYLPFLNQMIDLQGNFLESKLKIEKIEVKNNMSAILTNDKIKSIVFKGEKTLEKTQQNIATAEFRFSKSFLYVFLSKKLKDRELFFLECYGTTISIFSLQGNVVDFVVSDDFCVLFDDKNTLIFLEKRNNLIKEIGRIQKKNKILMDMNEDGVLALYDYENDLIEFYYSGKLINSSTQNDCSMLKWSQNGCFLACYSTHSTLNNFVQMFSSNGKLLWKQNFVKLEEFNWFTYENINEEIKQKIILEYDERIKALSMEVLENSIEKNDVGLLKRLWISFIESKKQLVKELLNK